jgi:hypothetical protein
MIGPLRPQDLIEAQLAYLDAYERLLAEHPWNEAKFNEMLKSVMLSLLPLLRAQSATGEQLLASQRQLIELYRQVLHTALNQSETASEESASSPKMTGDAPEAAEDEDS